MTKPLALIVYENLLPGTQLVTRFEDLGYRVQTLPNAIELAAQAQELKPIVIVVDLDTRRSDPCAAIRALKENSVTTHIPVIAYARHRSESIQAAAYAAGAALVANDTTIVPHLPQFLEQALDV